MLLNRKISYHLCLEMKMSAIASTGNEGCLDKGGKSRNKRRRDIGDTSE